MHVSPEELRDASRKISEFTTGTVPMSPGARPGTSVRSLTSAAGGVAGTDTANALCEALAAATSATEVVRLRIGAWASSLTSAADDFGTSDVESAERLAGLGDMNDRG